MLLMACLPANATLPVNPERPMNARTCREALDRIKEAAQGSPLLSADENRAILVAAIAQAERLCVDANDKARRKAGGDGS